MQIDQAFPSKYISAKDLNGRPVQLTIKNVAVELVGQGEDQDSRPVMYFTETQKGFVLNRTNANMISEDLGGETNNWAGQKLELFPARVPFGAKIVDAVRVKVIFAARNQPSGAPHHQAAPQGLPPSQLPPATFNGQVPGDPFAAQAGDPGPVPTGADPFAISDEIPF